MERKNKNRGFAQLRVWNDAIDLYMLTCKILSRFPYELKKTSSNCIDAAHSISRNIAEGYSRKSLKEYLLFLNYSMGSSGEYYSCLVSFKKAEQISTEEYEQLDKLHYKTENGLLKLIESIQRKLKQGTY